MKEIEIFTDGSCHGNPGPGGFGVIMQYQGNEKIIKQAYSLSTNNRMELLAVVTALEILKEPCEITLTSDSKYVTDAINKNWLPGWVKKGWRNSTGPLPNKDLWERLVNLLNIHKVTFVWVKGHASHPENNRCDALANEAIAEGKFEIDANYLISKGIEVKK